MKRKKTETSVRIQKVGYLCLFFVVITAVYISTDNAVLLQNADIYKYIGLRVSSIGRINGSNVATSGKRSNGISANVLYSNGSFPQLFIESHPFSVKKCLQKFPAKVNDNKNFFGRSAEEQKHYKKILGWTFAYSGPPFGFGGPGVVPFQEACCEEYKCFFTSNRTLFPVDEVDAILFHFRSFKLSDLPRKRSKHQRWVFYERESPAYSYQPVGKLNGLFNWTMTYRRDSDVYAGYGFVYPKSMVAGDDPRTDSTSQKSFPARKITRRAGKNVTAVWFVSHCKTKSNREKIVRELQTFVGMDVYGSCGKLKCPRKKTEQCLQMAEKEYKFYLSFENSICKDYITEKFYTPLRYRLVPVVFGAGPYEAVAPPHSYVDASAFKNVRALARYLDYLDRNETAYNQYFRWKETYAVAAPPADTLSHHDTMCSLCHRLHTDFKEKTYHDLQKWFVDDAKCIRYRPLG